ncbi:DUF2993 domain-containing protein [Herbiconiux flava]|uniref:DUF2993 domain-containing protein n=1 Tax=Herbiconiux flava TaxID=881268 RepID=A0A852SS22_9MICO|nr:DUF2993 domain-containing protein [Herbiconiux flava]NYD71657.1 hypothetical protein [Herbiconiux flava]GLK18379.1 hypothetical protein GCM10017602_28610 [Herbiconiux flava]
MTTETLPAETAPAPRRHRRWPWVLVAVLVLLAVALVVADIAFRAYAEGEAATQIEEQLPENVDGDVDVSIAGFSFLAQVAAGRLGEVTLDAPALTVSGIPIAAHVVATGVPTDLTKPVEDIRASISLDQSAVDAVVTLPGDAQLALGDGDVSYEGSVEVLGLSVGYRVTGQVSASGTDVVITPQDAELTQGGNSLDLGGLLEGVAGQPITVCVASYLPQGVTVDSLDVADGGATATASARDFVVDEQSLRTLGTCS